MSLIAVYIIGGFLYQRLVVGAKGMEQIPHFAFWQDLGNLVAVSENSYVFSAWPMLGENGTDCVLGRPATRVEYLEAEEEGICFLFLEYSIFESLL